MPLFFRPSWICEATGTQIWILATENMNNSVSFLINLFNPVTLYLCLKTASNPFVSKTGYVYINEEI